MRFSAPSTSPTNQNASILKRLNRSANRDSSIHDLLTGGDVVCPNEADLQQRTAFLLRPMSAVAREAY